MATVIEKRSSTPVGRYVSLDPDFGIPQRQGDPMCYLPV